MMRPRAPGRRERPWAERDTRRDSSSARGYNATWQQTSERYRKAHPLCVPCLLVGQVRPSRCVDHIVPAHSCPELFWCEDNWGAMCNSCHPRKTRKEPQQAWQPQLDRVVACGLPGTGKTTWARETGWPVFDADDLPELTTIEAIVAARAAWIQARPSGPCVVIVASLTTASQLAAVLGGCVRHFTTRYVDRPVRPSKNRPY